MVENSGDFGKKSIPERLWLFFLNEKKDKKKTNGERSRKNIFSPLSSSLYQKKRKKSPKSWKRKKINNRTLVDFDFPAKTAKQNPTKTKTKLNRKKNNYYLCV